MRQQQERSLGVKPRGHLEAHFLPDISMSENQKSTTSSTLKFDRLLLQL